MQPAKIKMGATPGVLPPGDPSYRSPLCAKPPIKLFTHNLTLLSKIKEKKVSAQPPRRKLSVKNKIGKSRPSAWSGKHVNKEDLSYVGNIVEDMLLNFCPFYVQSCITPETQYSYMSRLGERRKTVSVDEWNSLPDIEKGGWGSCAFVGLADTLLTGKQGFEIDNHDVVIRLGELPKKNYEVYVGTRTDVIWIRRSAKMAPRGTVSDEHKKRRLYIGHNNGNTDVPVLEIFAHRIRKNRTYGKYSKDNASPAQLLYERFEDIKWSKSTTKKRNPSSGFKDALLLISSRFCSRLDLYGFSTNCGGAYYNVGHVMQLTHNCELESWFLHYIMQQYPELGVCVNT